MIMTEILLPKHGYPITRIKQSYCKMCPPKKTPDLKPMSTAALGNAIVASGIIYRPYFWNSQSRLSSGQTDRALSHREMQWKWNAC